MLQTIERRPTDLDMLVPADRALHDAIQVSPLVLANDVKRNKVSSAPIHSRIIGNTAAPTNAGSVLPLRHGLSEVTNFMFYLALRNNVPTVEPIRSIQTLVGM